MSLIKAKQDENKVVTGKVRLSYTYLLRPRKDDDGQDDKYSVTMLIPKKEGKDTIEAIKAAQVFTAKNAGGKLGKIPSSGFNPAWSTLHDGDTEKDTDDNPEYKGCMYMQVASKSRPGIVDRGNNPLTSEDDVYPGMFARVAISGFAYDGKKKGVTFFLNHVQKLEDGDNLAGRTKPEDVFETLDEEDGGDLI